MSWGAELKKFQANQVSTVAANALAPRVNRSCAAKILIILSIHLLCRYIIIVHVTCDHCSLASVKLPTAWQVSTYIREAAMPFLRCAALFFHYITGVRAPESLQGGHATGEMGRLKWLNSLWPSDAIWRHGSGSTLAQVMACCLTAPSHYLNHCWLIICKVQWILPRAMSQEIP